MTETDNELHAARARIAILEAMLGDALPLIELCRTQASLGSSTYSARTEAQCEALIDRIERDAPPKPVEAPRTESFVIARKLLEEFISLDSRWGMNEDSFGKARQQIQQLIYGTVPVDAQRIAAALAACEGIDTAWLQEFSEEANIRLRGERERQLRETRKRNALAGDQELKDAVLRDIQATFEERHGDAQVPAYTFLPRIMRSWYSDLRPDLHKALGVPLEERV